MEREPDLDFVELNRERVRPQRIAASSRGVVTSQHYLASQAGATMLKMGGNAIDAAVATAFALGVVEPAASGLGGQTMALVHLRESHRTFAVDGSSRAPAATNISDFTKAAKTLRGHAATTIPSTPKTLAWLHGRYGKLPWIDVLEPSIGLARSGFSMSELLHSLVVRERRRFSGRSSEQLFVEKNGTPKPVGTLIEQPALANTLERISKHGANDFYRGEIARAIVADHRANDGLLTMEDLLSFPEPVERKPLSGRFGEYRMATMPPAAAGRMLIELINLWESVDEGYRDLDQVPGALMFAKLIRQALQDRKDRPFDPESYGKVSNKEMLDRGYAAERAKSFMQELRTHSRSKNSSKSKTKKEFNENEMRGETTHLSVIDGERNVVALTQSIERVFGSFEMAPDLGFFYNNYMSAFEFDDARHPYFLRPGGVPWASVAPTILFKGRKPWLAIGSPGSERIAPSIAQVLIRLRRQSLLDAISAPRFHCSLKNAVSVEGSRMRNDVLDAFSQTGNDIDVREPYSFYLGCVQAVMDDGEQLIGVADPRRDGSAEAPNP